MGPYSNFGSVDVTASTPGYSRSRPYFRSEPSVFFEFLATGIVGEAASGSMDRAEGVVTGPGFAPEGPESAMLKQ